MSAKAALANGELLKEAARHHRWKAYERKHPIDYDQVRGYSLVAACFMNIGLWPLVIFLPPVTALAFIASCFLYFMVASFVCGFVLLEVVTKKNFLAAEAAAAHDEARDAGQDKKHDDQVSDAGPDETHVEQSVCA